MKFSGSNQKRYNDYSGYIKSKYNCRVQKISVNSGLTCPNRDGSKGSGGCIYCNNHTFSPYYCKPDKDIRSQLKEGIEFFSRKYKAQNYFAYFQSYTNTYGKIGNLTDIYKKALELDKIIGIIIATRPDCIDDDLLNQLHELNKTHEVIIELGIESTIDRTLELINRCHTWSDSINAIKKIHSYGIKIGAHMIIGLPGESEEEIISHALKLSDLPIHTLKLHQLQIIKGTKAESMFSDNPELFPNYSVSGYIDLVIKFIEKLKPEIILERFISESPRELLISPQWNGIKNFEFVAKLDKRLCEKDSWQGKMYQIKNQ